MRREAHGLYPTLEVESARHRCTTFLDWLLNRCVRELDNVLYMRNHKGRSSPVNDQDISWEIGTR